MSGVQGVLSKICCCIEIETGGLIVAVSRLVLHLIRIMVGIILLMGGIIEGVETTTPAAAGNSADAAGAAEGAPAPPAGFNALYENKRELTKYDMAVMEPLLHTLAICWVSYYSFFFFISLIYFIGLRLQMWYMMIPMFLMTAADIFVPPFLGSVGIVFSYMMNDPYSRPAISMMIMWESTVGIFGFYIFCVVWGTILVIKNKKPEIISPIVEYSAPSVPKA